MTVGEIKNEKIRPTVYEICTSGFSVVKTADHLTTFDEYPGIRHLSASEFPYMVIETRGPRYSELWVEEERENLLDPDTEICSVHATEAEAIDECDWYIDDINQTLLKENTRDIFVDSFFVKVVANALYRTPAALELTATERKKASQMAQRVLTEEIREGMSYEEWKRAVFTYFQFVIDLLNTPERGEPNFKTAEEVYNVIVL